MFPFSRVLLTKVLRNVYKQASRKRIPVELIWYKMKIQ
jgi:hypothetical protein